MTYKIEQIEGIGAIFAERLAAVGVHTSDDLLARCETMEGRAHLAGTTDVPASMLMTWANQADLMRVNGIGTEFGHLLESSGIQSVTELSERKPENVVQLLDIVNEEKRLTRVVPPLKTVKRWVDRARQMAGVPRTEVMSMQQH